VPGVSFSALLSLLTLSNLSFSFIENPVILGIKQGKDYFGSTSSSVITLLPIYASEAAVLYAVL
jgi:hypothetical protein